jgi:hypothetical protein
VRCVHQRALALVIMVLVFCIINYERSRGAAETNGGRVFIFNLRTK